MDIISAFKFLLTCATSFLESKQKGIVVGVFALVIVWGAIVWANNISKPSTNPQKIEDRVSALEANGAVLDTKLQQISNALTRIEESEVENRRDLSELKNVLISKGK